MYVFIPILIHKLFSNHYNYNNKTPQKVEKFCILLLGTCTSNGRFLPVHQLLDHNTGKEK